MPATPVTACDATTITLPDGRLVLSFGGCNYLALANHPRVLAAVIEAAGQYGLSTSASRETTGNAEPHNALERELAAFLGVERVLLVPDGYIANIAACQAAKAGGCMHAVIDSRAHASMTDAAHAAGLKIVKFHHADSLSLSAALDGIRLNAGGSPYTATDSALIMTDGVFTADGEPAPLAALLNTIGPHAQLLVDDCHGFGVLGPGGQGSVAHAQLRDNRVLVTSSLAKGLGCAGGMVAGSASLLERCVSTTAYVCTTPIAPALAEGTRAALGVLRDEPQRVARLRANAKRLRAGLEKLGLLHTQNETNFHTPPTPIAAFTTGDLLTMKHLEYDLLSDGFRVPLIAYPGGPAQAYFRLSVNAEHTPQQIDQLLDALTHRLTALHKDQESIPALAPDPHCPPHTHVG